jgi:hypothetical protein
MGLYGGDLYKLKNILKGKSVINVLESKADEGGVCKLILSDGIEFDICATDLGWWIEIKGDEINE